MKNLLFLSIFFFSLTLFSCEEKKAVEKEPMDKAQALIDQAIEIHGGDLYSQADIRFVFRGKSYSSSLSEGETLYTRSFEEENNSYEDRMTSTSFQRSINGEIVAVPDTMIRKYRNSINSVLYFALLPYKLNDAAVKKKYLGTSEIEGKNYHKIEVRFAEEGGGEDHQDIFMYFIDVEKGFMDHLAYSYETEGGGLRFRKGYNVRTVNGIRFADYVNFKGDPAMNIQDIAEAYAQAKLDTLSLIELEDIKVK